MNPWWIALALTLTLGGTTVLTATWMRDAVEQPPEPSRLDLLDGVGRYGKALGDVVETTMRTPRTSWVTIGDELAGCRIDYDDDADPGWRTRCDGVIVPDREAHNHDHFDYCDGEFHS